MTDVTAVKCNLIWGGHSKGGSHFNRLHLKANVAVVAIDVIGSFLGEEA